MGHTYTCTMKSATIFMLLSGIAMLLQFSVDCKICPAVTEDVFAFIRGTPDQYMDVVEKQTNNQALIDNARKLKTCIDSKLTIEDKDAAVNLMKKINSSIFCKWGL
ncbi:major allergen I polypeptide chain 1-like isoform X2 [Dromiciops gliroides]|uniref:major allergen I polypeptide chain 1-like isoform X2 n=1 Tax=Dromiciops gliroides TaxID=33562 RepID=UPI001CC82C65|nr:major allergen I polypeptide chain 1-like isoform X2 [Dromiciops gliroides]